LRRREREIESEIENNRIADGCHFNEWKKKESRSK